MRVCGRGALVYGLSGIRKFSVHTIGSKVTEVEYIFFQFAFGLCVAMEKTENRQVRDGSGKES